ncbi:MAG: hypothetical protein IPJ07_18140 [Acidobacteria bacterium]|nr:hypothetical protein [Acidobacteriota bacterium]
MILPKNIAHLRDNATNPECLHERITHAHFIIRMKIPISSYDCTQASPKVISTGGQ